MMIMMIIWMDVIRRVEAGLHLQTSSWLSTVHAIVKTCNPHDDDEDDYDHEEGGDDDDDGDDDNWALCMLLLKHATLDDDNCGDDHDRNMRMVVFFSQCKGVLGFVYLIS